MATEVVLEARALELGPQRLGKQFQERHLFIQHFLSKVQSLVLSTCGRSCKIVRSPLWESRSPPPPQGSNKPPKNQTTYDMGLSFHIYSQIARRFALQSPKKEPPPQAQKAPQKPKDVRFGSLSLSTLAEIARRLPCKAPKNTPPPGSNKPPKTKRRTIWVFLATFAAKLHIVCPAKPQKNRTQTGCLVLGTLTQTQNNAKPKGCYA